MFELFYDYSAGHRVPERSGLSQPAFKLAFADYIEAILTVYSYGTTPMDLSAVVSWRGGIDTDKNSGTEPLVRLLDADFNVSESADGKLSFPVNCNTTNFQSRILSIENGTLEIYGHDADDRQIIRIRIEVKLYPAVDPVGDQDPLAVPPSSVRTLNGLSGSVVIKSASGEALPAANGVITLPDIDPGTSVNGLTGAVVLTDENGTPLTAEGQNIPIPGANCVGDAELAANNTFTGANTFTQPVTIGGYPFSGLVAHNDPLEAYAAKSATLGWYTWMDTGATPLLIAMTFDELQRNLKAVTFKAYSIDLASNGNVVLIPVVNGVDQTPVVIAVTPTATLVTIPLDVPEGVVSFRRDYASEIDTLDTSVVLYAITAWSAK